MSLFFLSFADSRYKRSLARIAKQAQSFNIFEGITLADEGYLDDSFRYKFKKFWCLVPEVMDTGVGNPRLFFRN